MSETASHLPKTHEVITIELSITVELKKKQMCLCNTDVDNILSELDVCNPLNAKVIFNSCGQPIKPMLFGTKGVFEHQDLRDVWSQIKEI